MREEGLTITTGSRLHFGPLAWKPQHGRDFGGWGVMLETPRFVIRIGQFEIPHPRESPEDSTRVTRQTQSRADELLGRLRDLPGQTIPDSIRVLVDEEPPPHCGFGSGTQLSLAITAGLQRLRTGESLPATELARLVGRGARSAVGVHGFDRGGLIVDAGKRSGDHLGQLAVRACFPEAWRFVLVRPGGATGLMGDREAAAFRDLLPFSSEVTNRLSLLVLTEILPAVEACDCLSFATALDEYGELVGAAFANCQGGVVHAASMPLWTILRQHGIRGMAQTSWGPTLAIVASSIEHAHDLAETIRRLDSNALVSIHSARNEGASIQRDG